MSCQYSKIARLVTSIHKRFQVSMQSWLRLMISLPSWRMQTKQNRSFPKRLALSTTQCWMKLKPWRVKQRNSRVISTILKHKQIRQQSQRQRWWGNWPTSGTPVRAGNRICLVIPWSLQTRMLSKEKLNATVVCQVKLMISKERSALWKRSATKLNPVRLRSWKTSWRSLNSSLQRQVNIWTPLAWNWKSTVATGTISMLQQSVKGNVWAKSSLSHSILHSWKNTSTR